MVYLILISQEFLCRNINLPRGVDLVQDVYQGGSQGHLPVSCPGGEAQQHRNGEVGGGEDQHLVQGKTALVADHILSLSYIRKIFVREI